MQYLTADESRAWSDFAGFALRNETRPGSTVSFVRPGLVPAFHFFTGMLLLARDRHDAGRRWIDAGLKGEQGGLFSNSFVSSYLGRNNGRLSIPETIFADPGPYIHFAGTPVLVEARKRFRTQCVRSLPAFNRPLRIMDIGCGHGMILADLLVELRSAGLVDEIGEILLIDPSAAMLELAMENLGSIFPESKIETSHARIEELSDRISGEYDIALASLAYHHMPYETKQLHLERLRDRIANFVLFELDANNDTPGQHSPEIALSVYQSYGAMIDFVFAHDAPIELALASIDRFLMSEAIYFFIEPRGKRSDYHMLRSQWHQVFSEGLGSGFGCLCDSTCHGDENVGLFTMIYGRGKNN